MSDDQRRDFLNEAVERFINDPVRPSPNTRRIYRQQVQSFISYCDDLGVPPMRAGYASINRFFNHLSDQGLATGTLKSYYNVLNLWFRDLVEHGDISSDANPFNDPRVIDRPTRQSGIPTGTLTLNELRRLLDAASELGPREHAITCLLAINGLRMSEVVRAQRKHLRRRQGRHELFIPTRKIGQWTPIVEPTLTPLMRHIGSRRKGPLIEWGKKGKVNYEAINTVVERAAESLGLGRRVTGKTLRNTAASIAHSKAVPTQAQREMLGIQRLGELHKFAVEVHPYADQHAVDVVARVVLPSDHLQEAERLLREGTVHPAASLVLAAAFLERHLRHLARTHKLGINEQKAKLSTYAGELAKHDVILDSDAMIIRGILTERDEAAHGWFDRTTQKRAERVLREARRLIELYPTDE